jgi:hypothetical protein
VLQDEDFDRRTLDNGVEKNISFEKALFSDKGGYTEDLMRLYQWLSPLDLVYGGMS